jgi:2-dehydropantoate 2-reductase
VPTPLRIAVLGPGGVGGLLAAVLARNGHDVVVLARPSTVGHVRDHGLTLHSASLGDADVRVEAAAQLNHPVDVVLVTVKATQLEESLVSVPPAVLGQAVVVPFLNGLDHVERLRQVYPSGQVATGTIRVEAERVAPGQVVHRSPFALVELAPDTADPAMVQRLAEALTLAGLSVTVREDARQALWDKLAVLAPLALFTTRAAAPWGVVRDTAWSDVESMVREISTVASAERVEVDPATVLAFLAGVPDGMRSSMQKDAEAGNSLELDAIGGSLLRAGAAAGVATRVTARVVASLR